MSFRERLLSTLRAIQPVLREPSVLIGGSEVPNLLETNAASTLVVSEDLDVVVPVTAHAAVKRRLREIHDLSQSPDEPSVWIPTGKDLIEVNFIGMDPRPERAGQTYIFEDPELPLLVFGSLGLLRPGKILQIQGMSIPLPRTAGLLLEKLVTDRSGRKGDRDLLVVAGLLLHADESDLTELTDIYRELPPESRYAVRSNLTLLSLLEPVEGMPDPTPHRSRIAELLHRLEAMEASP